MVWFGVLGPVAAGSGVGCGEESAPHLPPMMRTLLAVLAVHAGHTVPTVRLVDELWGEAPPQRAARSVQVHVCRLRRYLRATVGAGRVITRPHGYELQVHPEELDADRFLALAGAAGARYGAGDMAGAAAAASAALRLWRGPALADVRSPVLDRVHRPALEEQRLAVQELHIACELALGRHAELSSQLLALVAEHPLRERLTGQLMAVMARGGRPGEALAAYERLRHGLRRTFATEPGRELQALHRSILDRSTRCASPAPALVEVRRPTPPAELPPDVPVLIGRSAELSALCTALTTGRAPVVAVTGPTGAGTTALAVHAAHRLRDRFPGGQLHVVLRDPAGRPVPAGEVLRRVLETLGRTAAARAGPVLLVLDGVDSAEQVEPLLVADVAVAITSSTRLAGVAADARVALGELDLDAALALLDTAAGPCRIDLLDPAAIELIRLCGRLPLALRIAGARLAAKRHWTAAGLAHRLADPSRRLDELAAGDVDLRAGVLRVYRAARPAEQQLFRLLGGVATATVTAAGTASLVDASVPVAAARLDGLVDRHLLTVTAGVTGPRYALPALVDDVARELAGTPYSVPDRIARRRTR